MPGFRQLAREKTLVPECFEISGNSFDISKGIFQNDICKFESYMPSQCQGAEVFYRNAFVLAFRFWPHLEMVSARHLEILCWFGFIGCWTEATVAMTVNPHQEPR